MQNSLNRLRELWLNTSKANQTMLVTAVAAALLVGIGFVYWAGTPDFQPLVTNASAANSNSIINQLKEKKVQYRLNGTTIEVPSAQKDELRMTLAASGLLESGSLGYGLLEKSSFGQTQAMEQETIRRAHEGEMEKAIQSLEPVAAAKVHFADGDSNPFVDPDKKEGSASIVVHLKPGRELTKDNVNAIVGLVQGSYSNLSKKSINLVDGEGRLRWNGADQDSAASGSDERQEMERKYADDLHARIQQHIAQMVGPGKSSVMVRVGLNLDRQTEKKNEVLAGQKTSTSTEEENLQGTGSIRGPQNGPPGTSANVAVGPNYANGPKEEDAGKYVHTTSTSTMVPGSRETNTVKMPGEVKYVYAAVSLDKKIPTETIAALKGQIETIVGADPQAASSSIKVAVDTVEFDTSLHQAELKSAEVAAASERTNRMIGYAVPFVLMFVMLFILARSLKRAPSMSQLALAGGGMTPALAGAGAGSGRTGGGSGLDLLVGEGLPSGMSVEDALNGEPKVVAVKKTEGVHTYEVISEQFDANLESILHLAKSNPDTVAQLIRSWMSEEKKK